MLTVIPQNMEVVIKAQADDSQLVVQREGKEIVGKVFKFQRLEPLTRGKIFGSP